MKVWNGKSLYKHLLGMDKAPFKPPKTVSENNRTCALLDVGHCIPNFQEAETVFYPVRNILIKLLVSTI